MTFAALTPRGRVWASWKGWGCDSEVLRPELLVQGRGDYIQLRIWGCGFIMYSRFTNERMNASRRKERSGCQGLGWGWGQGRDGK